MDRKIKTTYVAIIDSSPIMSADSFENLKLGLDEYFGCDGRGGEYLCFVPHVTKYYDDYEGYFEYKTIFSSIECIDKVRVYSVEFYPPTNFSYDINKITIGQWDPNKPLTEEPLIFKNIEDAFEYFKNFKTKE